MKEISRIDVHGIKDLALSDSYFLKACWAFAIVGAMYGLVRETRHTVVEFLDGLTTREVGVTELTDMSNVIFCPKFWMNGSAASEIGMTRRNFRYFASLMPDVGKLGRNWMRLLFDVDEEPSHEVIMSYQLQQNRSAIDQLKNEFISNVSQSTNITGLYELIRYLTVDQNSSFFNMKGFSSNVSILVASFGACFNFTPEVALSPMDDHQPSKFGFTFKNPDPYILVDPIEMYDYFFFDEHDYFYRKATSHKLKAAGSYEVHIRPSKHISANVWRSPCKNWPQSDWSRCIIDCSNQQSKGDIGCIDPPFSLNADPPQIFLNETCTWLLMPPPDKIPNLTAGMLDPPKLVSLCYEQCPIPCEYWKFNTRIDRLDIDYDCGCKNFEPHSGRDAVKTIALKFRVNFPTWVQQITERQVYTAESLYSNIGGILSLFCGASMLSIFQLILLVGTIIKKQCCKVEKEYELEKITEGSVN